MSAVVLRGKGEHSVAIETVPVPSPGPDQLLARVDAAGICTSLIKTIEQGSDHTFFHGQDLARFPAILGDEGSVTLVRVGRNLQASFSVGSRYVVQPAVDHAPVNNLDRYAHCGAGVTKVGCGYTLPGLLAQYMLIPEEVLQAHCLLPVPSDDMPYAHTAIAEPFSCCVSGQAHHMHLVQDELTVRRRAQLGLKRNGVTVIVGLGAMGRMHVEVALAGGAGTLICSDPLESRRARTEELFANRAVQAGVTLLTTTPDRVAEVLALASSGVGADDLIVAVGAPPVIEASLPLLAKGGVASIFGGLKKGDEQVTINANSVHYLETCITGSSGGTAWDIAQTLDWMADGSIDAAPHIVKIGSMSQALDLIDDVRNQRLDGKAVLYPHQPVTAAFEVKTWSSEDEVRHLA